MDVLEAIGEPNRRRVVEILSEGERSAGEIAAHFAISRPAVSQHLAVLVDSGVLVVRDLGRRRLYSINGPALDEVGDWLDEQRGRWNRALDALERAMDEGET
ncbi:ArsR/SmtB family transcription factor [Nocardiopsis alba]|uniref:Bacterial regulatory, arsR family protein n=1 Tax=Nocardiopsis alba (strain ATCC BAA-2165 / BE74) TaxID=1205910 RepID=J7LH07_NOCAA|nr:metalloregulator ArsR/SmtB family transcription factor [Nocardiopsis alba]AFR10179.1 bacterial regulatory, arsR family protein [Nocardiopsis alba ATCC BAA-2165]